MMPATRTRMASDVHHPDDFIAYPLNRVVGTIADPKDARAAVEALLQAGFAPEEIDILQEEKDLHRPDPVASDQRFLAQFQRTLVRTLAGDYKHLRLGEEYAHLRRYIDDVRAGRSVMMVLAKKRDRREVAAGILSRHGATFIEFYGRWSWEPLEPHGATPGRTYEIDLGGTSTHVRLDSDSTATILRRGAGSDLSHLPVTPLRPQLLMIAWQEADRTTNVHVYDFENGHAHAVVSGADGRVHRAKGTVRRMD